MKHLMRGYLPYVLFIPVILLLDFATKELTLLYHQGPLPIASWNLWGLVFSWSYATNRGIAWGLGADYSALFLALRLMLLSLWALAPAFLALTSKKRGEPAPNEAFLPPLIWVFVLGGGLGNVVDMVMRGFVIDWISVNFWGWQYPLFNLADCCITLSLLALILGFPREQTCSLPKNQAQ